MMFFVTGVLCFIFVKGFTKPRVVPTGWQNVVEVGLDFVRVQIVDEVIGKAGRKYTTYLTALFFFILFANLTAILPGFHLPTTGVMALPLLFAVITWVLFVQEGIRTQGPATYFKESLFPPGVPKPIYILVTPIELISTFILRPATLSIRLLANMLAGHLILALFFASTTYLLFGFMDGRAYTALFGVAALAAGIGFTIFEALIIVLQAYIFTLLTAVYLAGSLEPDH